ELLLMAEARPAEERIRVLQDLDRLHEADVILSATSCPEPMIFARHLKENAVVSDISFPMNVDQSVFRDRADVAVIQGGLGGLPFGQFLNFPLSSLRGQQVYGCMAETMLLGMYPQKGHFSYGDINLEKMRLIRSLFYEEGFRLEVDRSWHH